MLKTAFITENKMYTKFFEKTLHISFFSLKDHSLQNYSKECECVIIDIIRITECDLENVLQQFKNCKKIIIVSSVPYNYLPISYKNILNKHKIKFELLPFTVNDLLTEIRYTGENN